MKKILFSAALVAVTMSSCSKNEIGATAADAPQAITFGTYVENATSKATVKEDFVAGDKFGVFAYYTDADEYAQTNKPNFMFNQGVTAATDGTGLEWSYSPLKYWPNTVTSTNAEGKVSFFAYHPTEVSGDDSDVFSSISLVDKNGTAFTTESAGDPCIAYTLVQADAVDLMWAVDNTTGKPFLNKTKQETGEKVAFQFKHALARVGFQITLGDDILAAATDETTVTINSIEFGGTISDEDFTSVIYGNGILNLNNTEVNTENNTDSKANWTIPTGATTTNLKLTSADFTNAGIFTYSTTTDKGFDFTMANETGSYLMIIPQDLTDKVMRITYTVSTKDGAYDGATAGSGKVDVVNKYVYTLGNFVNGKSYLYKYQIGLTSVKVSADIEDWVETEETIELVEGQA